MTEPRILVIVHGECEKRLVSWVGKKLKMKIVIDSKNDGKEAIRIENLKDWLSSSVYKSEQKLHNKFKNLEYDPRGNPRMPNLKIFILMDTENDRCAKEYISKTMFHGHFFEDRLCPIYFDPNMDVVFRSIGIGNISITKKPQSLSKILDEITPKELLSLVKNKKDTNLEIFLEYCISTRPCYQNSRI